MEDLKNDVDFFSGLFYHDEGNFGLVDFTPYYSSSCSRTRGEANAAALVCCSAQQAGTGSLLAGRDQMVLI
jgi:hypothetical protein